MLSPAILVLEIAPPPLDRDALLSCLVCTALLTSSLTAAVQTLAQVQVNNKHPYKQLARYIAKPASRTLLSSCSGTNDLQLRGIKGRPRMIQEEAPRRLASIRVQTLSTQASSQRQTQSGEYRKLYNRLLGVMVRGATLIATYIIY